MVVVGKLMLELVIVPVPAPALELVVVVGSTSQIRKLTMNFARPCTHTTTALCCEYAHSVCIYTHTHAYTHTYTHTRMHAYNVMYDSLRYYLTSMIERRMQALAAEASRYDCGVSVMIAVKSFPRTQVAILVFGISKISQ